MGSRFADPSHDRTVPVLGTVNDDGFGKAVSIAQRRFKIRESAGRRNDGRTNDVFLFRPLQHARNRGLGHVHDLGDLGLPFAFHMVHLGYSGDQSQLVQSSHGGLQQ